MGRRKEEKKEKKQKRRKIEKKKERGEKDEESVRDGKKKGEVARGESSSVTTCQNEREQRTQKMKSGRKDF